MEIRWIFLIVFVGIALALLWAIRRESGQRLLYLTGAIFIGLFALTVCVHAHNWHLPVLIAVIYAALIWFFRPAWQPLLRRRNHG